LSSLKTRDHSIDILRGIAIFAMIAANMAAYNYAEPHSFLFRIYGSLAAPIFVFLAGLMVPYTCITRNYRFSYFLKRGLSILIIAALIDFFLWQLIPFVTFDVLYMIGFSLPLAFLLTKMNKWINFVLCLLIFALTPFMQSLLGYAELPTELKTGSENIIAQYKSNPILNHFLVDGWFPLFPWLGMALLGNFVGRLRIEQGAEKMFRPFLLSGCILFVAGIVTWKITSPNLIVREGYSELFYPPTLAYFATFTGGILFLLAVLYRLRNFTPLHFFAVYGKSSLLMYILHTIFIVIFFTKYISASDFFVFLQVYLWHAFLLWWIALFIQLMKAQINRLPFLLRFILGG
jgi:uncharacterized membrane protein